VVVKVAARRAFVPASAVASVSQQEVALATARLDLRDFAAREGETALASEVLDHQLVDIDGARVIRAADLYLMVLITVALVVVQEMCARLGAYTGEGLGALIREQFSLRVTAFALLAFLVANVGLVVSEFAGVAAALELAGVSKFISIPVAAVVIWALVVFGSYRYAEKVFLILSLAFLAYPVAVADKGVGPAEYSKERVDAVGGAIFADLISVFIIVATAAAIKTRAPLASAQQAAQALRPVAGRFGIS
jgi:Mn2+/Fe2+ NRAMP family transporter